MLFDIISTCFINGIVPGIWKRGMIYPIIKPKSTNPRIPLLYRGIKLLSTPYKIYFDVLNTRLSKWLESNNLIEDEQNGFRRNGGCQNHIYVLYSIIYNRVCGFELHPEWTIP